MKTMIQTIKQNPILRDELLLRRFIKSLWWVVGVSFVTYLYFVISITFSVVERQGLERNIKDLLSEISIQELRYLAIDRELTRESAYLAGFEEPSKVVFQERNSNFALNAGR